MIPRLIHYCWFGKSEIPKLALKCIDSWKKYFPGWEIRLWNEENSPMEVDYMRTAHQNKNWSNMTNFMRLHVLKTFGGIYLDTDIEVIKPFDFLHSYSCFVGFENSKSGDKMSVNNAVIGSVKNHDFVDLSYNRLLSEFDGNESSNFSGPGLTTTLLKEKGLINNCEQDIDGVHVFSREKFHPFDWDDVFTYNSIKPGTYAIHYWNLSWIGSKTELVKLYTEKQNLVEQLNNAQNYISDFSNGRIKTKELLRTNLCFFKNFLKK